MSIGFQTVFLWLSLLGKVRYYNKIFLSVSVPRVLKKFPRKNSDHYWKQKYFYGAWGTS